MQRFLYSISKSRSSPASIVALSLLVASLGAGVAASGCTESADTNPNLETDRDPLLPTIASTSLVARDPPTLAPNEFELAVDHIVAAEEIQTIGQLDEPRELVFGLVIAIVQQRPNRGLLVLDRQYSNIRAFDPQSNYLWTTGGQGRGPGEFTAPTDLTALHDGRFLVTDANGRITLFEYTSSRADATESFEVNFMPAAACSIGDTVYFRSLAQQQEVGLVRSSSLNGGNQRRIVPTYEVPNPILRNRFSQGHIACLRQDQIIVTASDVLPFIRAFSADGQLIWSSELATFQPMDFKTREDGSVTLGMPSSGGYDMIHTVVPWHGRAYLLIQVAHHTLQSSEANEEYASLATYVLNSETGEGHYVTDSLPPVHYAADNRIYTATRDPIPSVKLFSVAPSGTQN